MKILVFSDSHGNVANMADVVRREEPDQILHLGDVVRDARALAEQFPDIPLTFVCGNCDGRVDVPDQLLLTVEEKTIMLTHGHIYGVKSGISAAVAAAREAEADVLLFGHTHRVFCDLIGEMWVMNPGSIGSPLSSTYGIIRITEAGMVCYTEPFA